ncbi:MAG: LacI family DNA-binding transcriptional regulator [Sphingomonadales bacterium]|nr:LacI family DNA-binding transcriptional regulator [Sphingomonadales bacterium]
MSRSPMKPVKTLKDLAALAGVTSGTVSRALAGSDLVTPATRDLIVRLAREHGFTPNVTARNLRTRRTGAIGVVIPLGHETAQQFSDPFFITMLGGLADALTDKGYNLLLSRVVPKDENWLWNFAHSGQVDGVIVIGQSDQSAVLDAVAERYKPLVAWGSHVSGQAHVSVGSDNFRGGQLAAQHLIERGCRRIAFFGDPRALEIGQRLEGCRAAMDKAGLADQLSVLPAHLVAEMAGPEIAAFLSSTENRPQGIVAASDVIAMSALRALSEHGLSVPADVKVVGYDNLPLCEHTVPRLTTIAQNIEEGAEKLADIVVRRIAGEDVPSVIMQPRLVIRAST